MKKKILASAVLIIILNFTSIINICVCQWQPDVRLTNDPAISNTSFHDARNIASSGNILHVVWHDNRDGNFEIYYKCSTDGGINWGADTRLTINSAISDDPSLSVSGSLVHIVWEDSRDGNDEIYYKRSTDGGINWELDSRLTYNSAYSRSPSITASGSYVYVVWQDYRDGNDEIYFKYSTDGGANWEVDTRLTNNTDWSYEPCISVFGLFIHVVWQEFRDGNPEIYYKRSTNGGLTWGTDTRLTNNSAMSQNPSILVSGTNIHVVWNDFRDGNHEIYYKRSTNGGTSWGADTRLTNSSGLSSSAAISVSGSILHVVWEDNRDLNTEIYYKLSTDGGSNWGTDIRLTDNAYNSFYPSITFAGSVLHAVWTDNRDGNDEIYYKRNPTGNSIGIINISSEIPNEYQLYQNYPNPFNPSTKIKFDVSKTGFVILKIYDIQGKEISTLANEKLPAGSFETTWNGSNYSSGMYFYKLQINGVKNYTNIKKMMLIK